MTITVRDFQSFYDPATHDARAPDRWSRASSGNPSAIQQLAQEPAFVVTLVATVDNDDGVAVDLTARGVLFPPNAVREIRLQSWCSTDNDHYYYETVESVLGGVTPVLSGQEFQRGWGTESGIVKRFARSSIQVTIPPGPIPIPSIIFTPESLPPFTHRLVMAGNNVTVKCMGLDGVIGDDKLRHRVEVYISALDFIDFEPN